MLHNKCHTVILIVQLLRQDYPGGVPKGHAAYSSKLDRDSDGYACEIK